MSIPVFNRRVQRFRERGARARLQHFSITPRERIIARRPAANIMPRKKRGIFYESSDRSAAERRSQPGWRRMCRRSKALAQAS